MMKKIKNRSLARDKNIANRTNDSGGQIPMYEPDDGMVTDEVIEQIKQLAPQVDFTSAESLF